MREEMQHPNREGRNSRIKRIVVRYAWAGPIIGIAIGVLLGQGSIWQYLRFGLESEQTSDHRLRTERELYERLQLISNDVLTEIPRYIDLRDRYQRDRQNYPLQNEFIVLEAKLVTLIREYMRVITACSLEIKLARLEKRSSPRFFVLPIPPPAPTGIHVDPVNEHYSPPPNAKPYVDRLSIDVANDVMALCQENGIKVPEDVKKDAALRRFLEMPGGH
jgi:hypothetical protein